MKTCSIWLAAILNLPFLSSLAQSPAPTAGATPPVRSEGRARPEGLTPELEAFLRKLIGTYQKAASYRDHGQVTLVQQTGRVKTTTEMPTELTFKRPNLFLLDGGQYTTGSDGKMLFFVVPGLSQYTANPAPEVLQRQDLRAGSILGGVDEGHPELIDFLIRPDASKVLLGQIAKIEWQPDAEVRGVQCRVLRYETRQKTTVELSVDTNRMVVLNLEARMAAAAAGESGPFASPARTATRLSYKLGAVELNPKLSDADFAFKPPPGFKRVTDFNTGGPGDFERPGEEKPASAEGAHLLNKPVPSLAGRDLDGRTLEAAEVQHKVVLLFFWSLSCGEYCLLAIPVVQQVTEHFKGRAEVLVLGVNGDDEQNTVVQLLVRKKAS